MFGLQIVTGGNRSANQRVWCIRWSIKISDNDTNSLIKASWSDLLEITAILILSAHYLKQMHIIYFKYADMFQNSLTLFHKGAAWCSGLHFWLVMWRSWVLAPSKASAVSFRKKLYPYCLVLVCSRNIFEHDFTIKLK